ncbi:hypothetical protein EJ04DRAFT_59978 [Polyplosphaeria fusca]|uniref:Uncharacterized protein n=1 Tax=Polyplosphaeria fusca TaxID=682080 RepID=A0A9P4R7N2_9PLEO|nr:hypothetical protein EJ04DRAFT_59978 [Polyplosphaeria fusca]
MAQSEADVLSNIHRYAAEARELHDEQMDMDASSAEARLNQTVQHLQARVDEQRAALNELRTRSDVDIESAAYVSNDPRERLKQLRAVTEAYSSLTPVAPYLPENGSALPALLAARTLQQTIVGTKDAIVSTQEQIARSETVLRREEANLHDAHALTKAMEARIERLRAQKVDRSQKTPAQLAKEMIAAKRTQQAAYNEEFDRLTGALNDFIEDHLSAMVAAEELGGPVVGDMLDPGNDDLATGFTKTGKAKSTKKAPSDSRRQKTIDQIWGKNTVTEDGEPLTEAEAADSEIRALVKNLFTTLIDSSGGKGYYELGRDSAAARFLVRAKIAQFHPKDASKIRLIDFGRELDD